MAQALGAVLTPDLAQAFVSTYRQCYADLNARQTQIYPGVMTTLQTLSTYTFGIVTTKDQSQAEFVLRRLALLPFFQHVEGGSSGLPLKPAPDTVLAALAALRCPPDQALMVGDTPADILAGKAAGTRTCAVTYGFGSRADLLHCAPDALVDHFGEVYRLVRAINGSRAAGLPASSGEV
jgi:HAD superfamily hydrolase (TIGR01509 family)